DLVLVAAGDRNADPDEAGQRGVDRHTLATAPRDPVPHDRRLRLRGQRLVRVRVGNDAGAVPVPERVADENAGRVRAGVADGRAHRDDVRDRGVAGPALADVIGGVRCTRDVVVVECAVPAVLDVAPVT